MNETILVVAIACVFLIFIVLWWAAFRRISSLNLSPLALRIDAIEKSVDRINRNIQEESSRNRQESTDAARNLREELKGTLRDSTEILVQSVASAATAQHQGMEAFSSRLAAATVASESSNANTRTELSSALQITRETQAKHLGDLSQNLQNQFDGFTRRLLEFDERNQKAASQVRAEVGIALQAFRDAIQKQMVDMAVLQKQQLDSFGRHIALLTERNEKKSDELRSLVEDKLSKLQSENSSKLDEMRRTVDEKLHSTLDRRLGESFKLVSDRLELVHQGLGEMQTLAGGVGDLKRMLTNVKTRGTWGEIQLGNLLDQILTPSQYSRNVRTKPDSTENIEFAIRLPGPEELDGAVVWLPIDAKFPKESYERLADAAERGDPVGVEGATRELDAFIRLQAREIRDKHIAPPHTTDFGLLYLPTEGLYAEVVRRPGLLDSLQREYRVVVVGPTTLAALLNSLQMGFRTLAIQKRSSDVWKVLAAVKTEFGKFGDMLTKVKKKLDETGNTIEDAVHRSRQIEKKLRKVEALPAEDVDKLMSDSHMSELDSDDQVVPSVPASVFKS